MAARGKAVVLACVVATAAALARAQDSRAAATPELRKAVEIYLAEKEEAAAGRLLDDLLRRPDASGAAVLAAVMAADVPAKFDSDLLVPYRDQLLATTVRMPAGGAGGGARPPVVFDIGGGNSAEALKLDGSIVAFVKGYTPPEFSDEGRDAFLKVLRTVAHRAGGDPDRLWLCGFSWGGHASYDVALHRPGVVRGIVPMGGGPRRTWFRLLSQLAPVRVLAFCGQKDDAELVWSLREVARLAPNLKLSYALKIDPAQGHSLPLQGIEDVAGAVRDTPPLERPPPSGTLLADAALVESPLVRIDAVDAARVAVPTRIAVPPGSQDEMRRATIAAMAAKVARLSWKIEEKKDETVVTLTPDGVTAATVFLREDPAKPGRKVTVRAAGKPAFSEVLAPDARTILVEARRTGDRYHPPIRSVAITFGAK